MAELEIVTAAGRRDLDEEARDAFRAVWPEFIFHDPVVRHLQATRCWPLAGPPRLPADAGS